ncbi:MAG: HEPN domain-containing protein [Armatimonadetes bacterium]|nr:HEPN domain-containing protein [Armatimonadota bacterium]
MKPEEKALVGYRMARAREALQEAELLLTNNHLNTAVNRLYYACFYAVSALLMTEGKYSTKHSGVRSFFDQFWINTGRLPVEMGRFYRKLFEQRQKSDYEDLTRPELDEVNIWLRRAREFVEKISTLIEEPPS